MVNLWKTRPMCCSSHLSKGKANVSVAICTCQKYPGRFVLGRNVYYRGSCWTNVQKRETHRREIDKYGNEELGVFGSIGVCRTRGELVLVGVNALVTRVGSSWGAETSITRDQRLILQARTAQRVRDNTGDPVKRKKQVFQKVSQNNFAKKEISLKI